MRLNYGICLCTLFCLFAVQPVASSPASSPMEQIRETTEEILELVKDPALAGPENKPKRRRLIRKVVDKRFDWEEMSQRALARHWSERTDTERKAFIELFGELLERTYMDRVEGYQGEKIVYESEEIENTYAEVKVKFAGGQNQIPVIYRLHKEGEAWLVYDISIEGVSLVNNYRNQFNSILVRSSFDELMDKLKKKVEEES